MGSDKGDGASGRTEALQQQHISPPPLGQPLSTLPVFDSVASYEKLHRIGEGTYGVVYKARERATGDIVALKKVRLDRSRDGLPVTSIRELRVLQQAGRHPNIVALKKVVTGTKPDSVFLVFEYCEHDLGRLLDSLARPFSLSEIKCLLKQLLGAVAHLHSRWLVHRDLKMSNLLYTRSGMLKVCDFGLARYYHPEPCAMTPNVVTLWYRAPEVLLGADDYDEAVDMWSVGCIFAELVSGQPLFPSRTEMESLKLMTALLGTPSVEDWPTLPKLPGAASLMGTSSRADAAADPSHTHQPSSSSCAHHTHKRLAGSFPALSGEGVALLAGLLTWDPCQRLTARQALRHPFFQERPYPKLAIDMPTFPSTHDNPNAQHHQHQHQHQHQPQQLQYQGYQRSPNAGYQQQPYQQQPCAIQATQQGVVQGGKRPWQAGGELGAMAAKRMQLGGGGGGGYGLASSFLDARFGQAFGGGGSAGTSLLDTGGVRIVRQ